MNIFFVRHGETAWNKARRFQGQSDIPLNDYGRELAVATREGLGGLLFQAVYSSPLIRAKETAEIITKGQNVPIIEDERIKEIAFGTGEGSYIEEIRSCPDSEMYHFLCNPEQYIPPEGGETLSEMVKRCESFVREVLIPAEKECENVLVVAHGALIRGMICYIEKIPFQEFWERKPHKNCAVTIFECKDKELRMVEEGKLYY